MTDVGQTPNTTITPSGASPSKTGGLKYDDVENIWINAGGNPQAAAMAAAIADSSSGLNPDASYSNPDGTESVGLWLIPKNGMPPGSTDPIANARAAIQLSNNGTDWTQWCTAWSDNNCGQNQGTYLGEGANALASLGQRLTPASYNVIGSAPTGAGTGASSVSPPTTGTSSKLHSALVVAVLLTLLLIVFVMVRRKTGESGEAEESQGRSQAAWSPGEEAQITDSGKSDRELSSDLGRSVRSIRVRRNQMKG